MGKPLDARLELHERTKVGHACDAARPYLADLVVGLHGQPRVVCELLQSERNLLRALVDTEHLDGDLVT